MVTVSPAHPRAAAAGRRHAAPQRGAGQPSRPPAPSSHARVGSEKKAHGWLAWVSQSDIINEPMVTSPSRAAAFIREGPPSTPLVIQRER